MKPKSHGLEIRIKKDIISLSSVIVSPYTSKKNSTQLKNPLQVES